MASLHTKDNGRWAIQFTDGMKRRHTIYPGKLPQRVAENLARLIGDLNALVRDGLAPDADTTRAVSKLGDDLAEKLAKAGLIPPRQSSTLAAFLAAFAARRALENKPTTVITINTVTNDLVGFFRADADLRSITPALADDFRTHYLARKLAKATISRRLKMCRMLFGDAVDRGLIPSDPFAGLKTPTGNPDPARRHYVPRADAYQVIEVCPPDWQAIIALSRFAGLRCPSEVLALRWEDVGLVGGKLGRMMTVRSPKTEHHAGGACRDVPIFPDLKPYLEAALERARESGAEYVVNGVAERARAKAAGPSGLNAINLGTVFIKLVKRAGLKPWPKIVHNMRASCQTDLVHDHPTHVVCRWLGNTPSIADKHYYQTLETDVAKALAKTPTAAAESAATLLQKALSSHTVPDRPGSSIAGESPRKEAPGGPGATPDKPGPHCTSGQGGT